MCSLAPPHAYILSLPLWARLPKDTLKMTAWDALVEDFFRVLSSSSCFDACFSAFVVLLLGRYKEGCARIIPHVCITCGMMIRVFAWNFSFFCLFTSYYIKKHVLWLRNPKIVYGISGSSCTCTQEHYFCPSVSIRWINIRPRQFAVDYSCQSSTTKEMHGSERSARDKDTFQR